MTVFNRVRLLTLLGLFGAMLVLGASVGCSDGPRAESGKVIPRGRILKNGLPLKPSDTAAANMPPGDSGIQITFIKLGTADAGAEIIATMLDEPPGSFELIGDEARGIPPGKYRVAVFLGPIGGTDELKGKYSRENSKIEVEVKEGEDLIIDLANYP